MLPDAVALYGPPAAGKDTVTAELTSADDRYIHFDRLKVGTGAANGYRYVTPDELEKLRDLNLIVYENERYGNVYATDRPRLDEIIGAGRIPVVHLGQVAGLTALRTGYPARWLTVLLWCPRDVTLTRLRQRSSVDVAARLSVWDETRDDLSHIDPAEFTMVIRTDHRAPRDVAEAIHQAATGTPGQAPSLRDALL